jgi:hypothetical protein
VVVAQKTAHNRPVYASPPVGGSDCGTGVAGNLWNKHKGEWGQMEKRWAVEIEKGNAADVKIEPQYHLFL